VALKLEDDASTDNANDKGVANLSKVVPINPNNNDFWEGSEAMMRDEEKDEVFQLAARALIDKYGQEIQLKKTPCVLTIEGDMDCVVGDLREALLGGGIKQDTMVELSINDALNVYDDEDGKKDKVEGEDYFNTIMRRDLGDDYESLFDDGDDTMDKGLLRLFSDTSSLRDGSLDNDDHGV
jgi:hypothetical protein